MSAPFIACDRAAIVAAAQGTCQRPRLVLTACILASSLAFIDGSVTNVGLPAIGLSLRAPGELLPWVMNAYTLPLSALLLFGGATGDKYGRRRLLVVGIVIFALASAACALAPTITLLLVGRAVQGAGAAILLPNSLAILGGAFSGVERGRAVGTWAAVSAMAAAIGPVLGGWLIDTAGWRSIFLINLPVAAGAVALALWTVAESRADDGTPLDRLGAVLATSGLGALTWGLTIGEGPGGWTLAAIALAVGGGVLLAAFVVVERRLGEAAMAPLSLFGSAGFVGLTLLTLLDYGALGGLLVLIPYELIRAGGYSATAAGAALLPFPLLMAAASPYMGRLAGRFGSRIPLIAGSVIVGVGLVLAVRIGSGGGYWTTVLPAILIVAMGMSGVAAPLTNAVINSVDARHTGEASGLNSAVARAGGLIATALIGGVLASSGGALTAGFRLAMLAFAVAAFAAAAAAFALMQGQVRSERQ
ncbi:MAG TPA: MFS transporter [Caulobacteraceae bacterium]|nr:MFS transporter [Caulobacteraceae bacterium]